MLTQQWGTPTSHLACSTSSTFESVTVWLLWREDLPVQAGYWWRGVAALLLLGTGPGGQRCIEHWVRKKNKKKLSWSSNPFFSVCVPYQLHLRWLTTTYSMRWTRWVNKWQHNYRYILYLRLHKYICIYIYYMPGCQPASRGGSSVPDSSWQAHRD